MTKRIKVDLKLSDAQIADDIDSRVGQITTNSPEAFKYYSQGRRLHNLGDFRQSIRLMEKATAIDSEFAMAYRSMGSAYYGLGYYSEGRKYRKKAYELRDRVSERERFLISIEGAATADEIIAVYTKFLQLYPDDELGNAKFALFYLFIEEWDKAIYQADYFVRNKVASYFFYINQAYAFMARGRYDKAHEVLECFLDNIPDNVAIRLYLAGNFICQRKYDLAIAETDKIESIYPGLYHSICLKGDIYHWQGDVSQAAKQYRVLLEYDNSEAQRFGAGRLGMLYLL